MPNQEILLEGHLLDSLTLPKVMDMIVEQGGDWELIETIIGQKKTDLSRARLLIKAPTKACMDQTLIELQKVGAIPVHPKEVNLSKSTMNGAFPENFYSTTNLVTEIYLKGKWVKVKATEMDCGIVVQGSKGTAKCQPMNNVKKGDWLVVGNEGVKVTPLARERDPSKDLFQFMNSGVSSEKHKGRIIATLAEEMKACKKASRKILFVTGPAVVHTGANIFLEKLVHKGYVQILFSGNGFATHDIERSFYGTSLGVSLEKGSPTKRGHENHVRAINKIRLAGGMAAAVKKGILKKGVMAACVKKKVKVVLAGSVRDDGPMPEVINDTQVAQQKMRDCVPQVGMALMLASGLHGIATGNLLPASTKTVFVDINPAIATKLVDRGTFQSIALVTDTEAFLRELCRNLT